MTAPDTIPWSALYPFERDAILEHAPKLGGLYKLVDRSGETAYIGISQVSSVDQTIDGHVYQKEGTSSIQRRLLNHWEAKGDGNKYIARLRAYEEATGGGLGFTFAFYVCDPASARAIEAIRTITGKPVLNTRTEWSGVWEEIVDGTGRIWRVKHQSAQFH